jgi:hypothetical protein
VLTTVPRFVLSGLNLCLICKQGCLVAPFVRVNTSCCVSPLSLLGVTGVVQYVRFRGSYKLSKKSLRRSVQLSCSTGVSLFFNLIPVHIDAFTPSWHEFNKSVALETGLLRSQPLTNSHLHAFITVESATSQVLLQRLKQREGRKGKVRTIGP